MARTVVEQKKPITDAPQTDSGTPAKEPVPVVDKGQPEGAICGSSDECKLKYGCLMTFNKTAEVKTAAYQYFCVEDTKLGCLVGGRNVLIVKD